MQEALTICPVYKVELRARVCAVRHRNATADYRKRQGFCPGSDDFACRDCEIGRRLLAAGLDKQPKQPQQPPKKEATMEKLTCRECGGRFTAEEMGTHPVSKKPWKLCPECRARRMKAGQARKRKADTPAAAKTSYCGQAGPSLTLDFTGCTDLLAALEDCAHKEFRDPECQVLYIISEYVRQREDRVSK